MKAHTLGLLVLAAPAIAQIPERVLVSTAPAYPTHVMYDRARQRLVAIASPLETWSFDGSRWRLHLPDELAAVSANTFAPLVGAYDDARGEAVVVTDAPSGGTPQNFVGHGAGWRSLAAGSPLPRRAATASDPITNSLMTFGGVDRMTNLMVDSMYLRTGSGWSLANPAVRPSPRQRSAMATDRSRGRVVLFGGYGPNATVFGDTWEWDGMQWTQMTPAASPPPRHGSMAYDPAAQRVVLLGGISGPVLYDCWDWDGVQWAQRSNVPETSQVLGYDDGNTLFAVTGGGNVWRASGPNWLPQSIGPGLRSGAAFAYDPTRGEALVVAGQRVGGHPVGTTWAWNGTWQQRSSTGPSGLAASALAPLGSDMVLFGGFDLSASPMLRDDTWSWNGQAWSQVSPAQRPPARWQHAMVNAGNHVLLFGGENSLGSFSFLADTWRFDGVNWTQLQPAFSPPARAYPAFAFDPIRQRAVLFGGYYRRPFGGSYLWVNRQDTWEWDGSNWGMFVPVNVPPAGSWGATYDGTAGAVVISRGDEMWHWNGNDWSPSYLSHSPRQSSDIAFDITRQQLLFFGGVDLRLLTSTPANVSQTVQSCGNLPDLRLLGRPSLGSTPDVHVEGAANSLAVIAYGLQSTQVNWAPGCDQLVIPDATLFGVLDATGQLDVPLSVPFDPALRGVVILTQAAVLDGGPVFGVSLTGRLRVLVGD